jgi:hypothetical protein
MKLEDYRDLETADATIDYSKLTESFWESVRQMMIDNDKKFDELEKSMRMSYKARHTPFDL